MFTFEVQYRDQKGCIKDMSVSLQGKTREMTRLELEQRFRRTFPNCTLIHIGG